MWTPKLIRNSTVEAPVPARDPQYYSYEDLHEQVYDATADLREAAVPKQRGSSD